MPVRVQVGSVVAFVALLALAGLLEGGPVPTVNELVYLPLLRRRWDSSYLAGDWTFGAKPTDRFLFELLFGPLTFLLPLDEVGWAGRLLVWAAQILALLRLGRHFGLSPGLSAPGIGLWLLYGQSLVAGEFVIGTFEAKGVAYAVLFLALCLLVERRDKLGAFLLGLSLSFHLVVGLWGVAAGGLALLVMGYPARRLAILGAQALLGALPGIVAIAPVLARSAAAPTDWELFARVVMPLHFDATTFSMRRVVLLFVLLGFGLFHLATRRHDRALRFFAGFETALALAFVAGLLAQALGQYRWLQPMPFRLFPVVAPLFFFLRVMRVYRDDGLRQLGVAGAAAGLVGLLSFGSPLGLLVDRIREQHALWTRAPDDDLRQAFAWVAANTPSGAVVLGPPWRRDAFYYSQRAQVVNWYAVRLDDLAEWRARMEALVGDIREAPRIAPGPVDRWLEDRFGRLGERSVEAIARRYGAGYLVSGAEYPFRRLFESGPYKVYTLDAADPR